MSKYTILVHNVNSIDDLEFYDCDMISEVKELLVDIKRMWFDNYDFDRVYKPQYLLPMNELTLKELKRHDVVLYAKDDEIEIVVSYNGDAND